MAQNPKRKKKTKIIPLFGAAYSPGLGAEPDIVLMLETLLARAKKGELIGFSYSAVQPAGCTEDNWVPGRAGRHQMISCVEQLHHNFMRVVFDY